MSEQITTLGNSTLSAAITSTGATSLTIASPASGQDFPSSPTFRIKIDNEIMAVTARSGTTFTVTRGTEGTTAATHSNAAAVTEVLTAVSLLALIQQNGATSSNGLASLAANFDVSGGGFTFPTISDISASGFNVTLPTAGTYLVWENLAVQATFGTDAFGTAYLTDASNNIITQTGFYYHTALGLAVPNLFTMGVYVATGSTNIKMRFSANTLSGGQINQNAQIGYCRIA